MIFLGVLDPAYSIWFGHMVGLPPNNLKIGAFRCNTSSSQLWLFWGFHGQSLLPSGGQTLPCIR